MKHPRQRLILIILVTGLLAVGPLLAVQAADWPDCDFHCTAKDVVLTGVYAVVPTGTCEAGSPVAAEIWGVFDANATRYAVWLQADVYQDGVWLERIEQCLLDTIPRGTTQALLGLFEWECGTALELRDVIVSWTAKRESCADPPTCEDRSAKCSRPTIGVIRVETPLAAGISSDAPKCAGEAVHFENSVSGGTPPYSYLWNFGDGGGSVDSRPGHVYSEAGDYTVRVIVTDAKGQRADAATDVSVLSCFYRLTLSATVGGKVITPGQGEFRYPADSAVPLQAEADPCYRFDGWTGDTDLLDAPSEASTTAVLTQDAYLEAVFVPFDEEPPLVHCPPDATVECGESTAPDDTGWATAIDNCDPSPDVSYSDTEFPGDCPGQANLVRLWITEDASGNVARCEQRIAVVDTTPPITKDDFATTPEDTPVTINVCDNDSDLCSTALSVVSVAEPIHGTALLLGDGVQYHPPSGASFAGTDTFSYVVRDCSGNRALGLVEVEVTPVNDPPVARNQTRVTDEDTPTGFFSLAITDPDNTLDELICDCVTPPVYGSVERGPNHNVNYIPAPDFSGTDTFTYEVCDPAGLCATATVTIVVTSENDNPIISSEHQTTTEDIPVLVPVVHVDPDGDPLLCVASGPAHGIVVPAMATITGPYPRTDWLTYTPGPNFYGVDNFVITCDDGNGGSDAVLVEVTVFPANDPPVATDQTRITTEDRKTGFFSLDVSDPDNTLAEVVCDCVAPPVHGTVERGPNHTVNYTPNADFAGTDSFTYKVCDPGGLCDTATVTVEVTPVNDPPVAVDDLARTEQSTPVVIDVLANDFGTDNPLDPGTVTVLGRPSAGRTSVDSATGEVTYIPRAKTTGIDTFLYQVCDSAGLCGVASVTVEVVPVSCGEKVEFVRRLSGSKTGQHKAPPTSLIEMTLFITISSPLENVELVEFLPDGWSVANPGGGVVGGGGHTITWELGAVSGSLSRSYKVFSPQKILPPTDYVFHSELRADTCSARSADWRVVVADPVIAVVGGCIDDVTGRTNNCTANDVGVYNLYILETKDGCISYDDTACLLLKAEIIATAANRYDIGIFLALDGGDARTGTCAHDYLSPPLAPSSSYEPDGGPYLNFDGDACGDIEQGVPTFYYLPEYCVPCSDMDSDGTVDIGHCVSWDNQASANCASVGDTVPSTKAKCNCSRSQTIPSLLAPNLTLSKSCSPSQVSPDSSTTCTITITNTGAGDATLIGYRNDYDQTRGSVSSISNGGIDDGDLIAWSVGTIPAGATVTLSYVYTVNPDVSSGTLIADLVTTYWNDIPQPQTASATIEVVGYAPAIKVVKSGPTFAHVGDTVTYTYEVTNDDVNGDGSPIRNVGVSDDVAGGASYVGGDTNTNGLLEVGETWVFEGSYTIQAADPDPLVNVATATGKDGDDDPVTDQDTHGLDVIHPSIAVTKDPATQQVRAGEPATFEITVTNDGDVPLVNVVVSDPLAPDCNRTFATLAVGASETYTCTLSGVTADFTNGVTVTGTDPIGGTVSDSSEAFVDVLPTITVDKNAQPVSIPEPGDTVSFTIRVKNTGTETVTLTSLVDSVYGDLGGKGSCEIPQTILPGGFYECSFSAFVSGVAGESKVNEVFAQAQDGGGNVVEGSSSATVTVKGVADLEVSKSVDNATPGVGDLVTFSITVTNNGPSDATGVRVEDVLPAQVVYGSDDGGGTYDSAIGAWEVGSLVKGASATIRIAVRVVTPGSFDNIAQVSQADQVDPDSTPGNDNPNEDDQDSVRLNVGALPALVTGKFLVKITRGWASVGQPVEPGDVVTFELGVQNVGTGTAYDVDIADELPDGFEYLFGTASAGWPLGSYTMDPSGAPGPSLVFDTSATLRPGERLTLTFKVLITSAVRDGGTYTNVMYASGLDSEGVPIPTDQSLKVPEDTDLFDSSELRLLARIPSAALSELPCKTSQATADRIWFQTDIAMYAASEFELLGELAEAWTILPDTLLPTWIRTVQAESERYAFDNLVQVNTAAEVGLGLAYGPRVLERAGKEGIAPEAELENLLSQYQKLAGLSIEEAPQNERWIFAEFAGGDPRYEVRTDDIWPGGSFEVYDRRIIPSALGMGLVKQVMEAKGLLASGTPLDQYLALVLTEGMVNKLLLLDGGLALELPEKGIRYFAHVYQPQLDEQGRPTAYTATDTASHLFDQVALLWGLSEFADWADPGTSKLFGEGKPFGAEYREIALKLMNEVFETILTLHRDGEGYLWDVYGRIASPGEEGSSWDVYHRLEADSGSTANLGLLLVCLARAQRVLGGPEDRVRELFDEQAANLLARELPTGGFADALKARGRLTEAQTLAAQMSAIRGLLAGYGLTGDDRYLAAAQRVFAYLERVFWDESLDVYASWVDGEAKEYCYSPFEVGLAVGALRELASVLEPGRAEPVLLRLGRFFRAVVDEAALQLSNAVLIAGDPEKACCEIFHGNGLGEIAPLAVIGNLFGVAPVLQQRLCLDVTVSPGPCCGTRAEIEPWFQTDIAMYAAYELQEFAPWGEDYADANLASLTLHSGMGIPLAQEEVTTYAELAGLVKIPELTPLALEFFSGSPRLQSLENLAWNSATFDKRIVGSAIGMTLLREVQEAAQLLAENRVAFLGRSTEEGFYGLLLVGAIQSKLAFLDKLAQDMLEQTGTPHIPHAVRALTGDGQLLYEVVDSRSVLFDQLALLWGLSEAYGFVTDSRYVALFGPRTPFPLATSELVARLAEVVLTTLLELHFNPNVSALPDTSTSSAEGWRRGEEITTRNLGLAIAALESVVRNMADRPELQDKALELIRNEAEFLTHELADGSGGYFERYVRVDEDWRPDTTESRSLAGQLSAIRGLLVAYDLFGDEGYLALAQAAFDFLEATFWDRVLACCEAMELYRSPLGAEVSCYTPLELGLAVGALERLAEASDSVRAELIRERLRTLLDRVAGEARLQLPGRTWMWSSSGLEAKPEYFASVVARRVCFLEVCE